MLYLKILINVMKYLLPLFFAVLSLNAVGQISSNYNPDYDADGTIGVSDLLGFLGAFGYNWDSEELMGCTYPDALEYNPLANIDDGTCTFTVDCAGVLNGSSLVDECGVCDSDPTNNCVQDCAGVMGGTSTTDECGTCDNDSSNDCVVFQSCGDLIGHEGYNYSTVQIGDQCWFSENSRYLPEVSPLSEASETVPYYYVYGYEGTDVAAAQATANYETYGVLYNWPAVMTEGICPSGWHIPSDGEFTQLTDFLGGQSVAGCAMKSTSGWNYDGNGTNSSGFTGLPGGARFLYVFNYYGDYGCWWSASESESGLDSWGRELIYTNDNVLRDIWYRFTGFSARCVRD
jgi:uncharacterized protein (TIGR02145 family)